VAQRHVRHLVGQHAGQLALVARGVDGAAVDVHVAARQRERVDVGRVHDLDLVGPAVAGGLRGQAPDDVGDVLLRPAVAQDGELPFRLGGRLLADLELLLLGEDVEPGLDLGSLGEHVASADGDRPRGPECDGGREHGAPQRLRASRGRAVFREHGLPFADNEYVERRLHLEGRGGRVPGMSQQAVCQAESTG
jgi:hypothetical protein